MGSSPEVNGGSSVRPERGTGIPGKARVQGLLAVALVLLASRSDANAPSGGERSRRSSGSPSSARETFRPDLSDLSAASPPLADATWGSIRPAHTAAASGTDPGPAHDSRTEPLSPGHRDLSFDDRVAAQRAIEEVYWRHRTWPAENHGRRPSFEDAVPEAAIRAKALDAFAKSMALKAIWGRPITSAQLQAEIDRMARDSRRPQVLKELYAALAHDPLLVAECLARPALADRLVRGWYARDRRFHEEIGARAASAASACGSGCDLRAAGGEYRETTYRLARGNRTDGMRTDASGPSSRGPDPAVAFPFHEAGSVDLTEDEWHLTLRRLSLQLGAADAPGPDPTVRAPAAGRGVRDARDAGEGRLPLMRPGPLREEDDGFSLTTILEQSDDLVRAATVTWVKTPFEDWWQRRSADRAVGGQGPDLLALESRRASQGASPVPGAPYVLPAPGPGGCSDDAWRALTKQVPEPRFGHTLVWTGSEMIVWGGSGGGPAPAELNSGGRYDPATDTWRPTSTRAGVPAVRQFHSAIWTGTEMIVWGGYTSAGTCGTCTTRFNSGGRYDPVTDAWSPTSTGLDLPLGRSAHTAVWTGTEMIVWGGSIAGVLNTGGRYDPFTDSWRRTSVIGGVPTARANHSAVWTGAEMIVWGGGSSTGGRYNPATDDWRVMSVLPNTPSVRFLQTAVWTGSRMIVWGGLSPTSTALGTGGTYDPLTDSWETTSTGLGAPDARFHHAMVWTGMEMIVWGGMGETVSYLNSGSRYDPTHDTWTPTSLTAAAPSARLARSAIWTGSEMIVWGGFDETTFLNSGGRYDPSTDLWTPTSVETNVPSERYGQTVVWSGSEMIVWGGFGARLLSSGARYDPATETWTPTGTAVPAPRLGHTAVWTGREMIVWGGSGISALLDSGGRYDPASGAWLPTSGGAPEGRRAHTAVWTGTEMIVWGGEGALARLDTGGRYDPARDAWSPTGAGAGLPTPRDGHSAVWAGSRMVVWGGNDFLGAARSGGVYSPLANEWSPTGLSGLTPAGRAHHTAVWTGREMIVWGGSTGAAYPILGGRYDPRTNAWLRTSTGTNVPTGRIGHSAVWTGSEMIVWGGSTLTQGVAKTGGRYDPAADAWRATDAGGAAPDVRQNHTAVWTGEEMLVWGGFGGQNLATGGGYCADPVCTVATWYGDVDGDGYGNDSNTVLSCGLPLGYLAQAGDCNDVDLATNPAAPETCDNADNDCDGTVDEDATCSDGDSCTTNDACAAGACAGTPIPPPAEVGPSLTVSQTAATIGAATTRISWDGSFGPFNVYRGSRQTGLPWAYNHGCMGGPIAGSSLTETLTPPPGTVFVYLVTRAGACGESIPGSSSWQAPIPNDHACPDPGGDLDEDGLLDQFDDCPYIPDPAQSDADSDGHGDPCDNCPLAYDQTLRDRDSDSFGDVCDPDIDGDGIANVDDDCPGRPDPDQTDSDADGIGDACDNCPAVPNPDQRDYDNDNVGDPCDPTPVTPGRARES